MKKPLKRYHVTAQFYIWAENDQAARNQAEDWSAKENVQKDNRTNIYSIVHNESASMECRLVYGAQVTEFKAQ